MQAYEIQQFGIENLALTERETPKPEASEVLVKFHAASLNYRDLMMITGVYNPKLKLPVVPFSDGAGEVVEIGSSVTKFKVGDRVMPIFNQGWFDAGIETAKPKMALGGDIDGVLREYAAFDENGLVCVPDHLNYEEAATLPCAAVTAYNALFCAGSLNPADTVLLQGTGGVSIFALQFAAHLGARTIITSSNDEKLNRAKKLGANEIINYINEPDWDERVRDLTGKRGADYIVEVGGAGTIQKSVKSVRAGGDISVIGVLSQGEGLNPVSLISKSIKLQGIFVGSRQMFEDMTRMISQHHLKPVIDKTFEFGDVRDALKYMESGSHFGKIVVKI